MNAYTSAVLALFLALAASSPAAAADYYVDQNHRAAADANRGTADRPWKTLAKANQTLAAGDTVHIKAGTYNTYIAPERSGTAARPITYRNFGRDVVTIADAAYGIHLDGKSYVVVTGIHFSHLDKFLWLQDANRNTIAYCNFDRARTVGWSGSKIYKNSSHNRVHHCRFSAYGRYTHDDIGTVLDIGDETVATDVSNYNLLEECVLFHGGHHVLGIYGMYNVVRSNYLHNENWLSDHGNRVVYLNGHPQPSGRNLIEGNRIGYSGIPPDNAGGAGMSMASMRNIVRRNCFYHNNLPGITMTTTRSYPSSPQHNRVYHNTFFNNGFNPDPRVGAGMRSAIGFARYSGGPIAGNAVRNNLFHGHPAACGAYRVSLAEQTIAGNWEGPGDPLFVNAPATPGDPMDADLPDLHLRPKSPCVDAGIALTTVTSGSGSGRTLQVEDAGYFMDGWGIVDGDTIQLAGTAQRARVTKADYETHALTVDRALTWTQGQGVSLAYEGAGPDAGAHETRE